MFSAVFEPAQFGSWLMSILAAFGAAPSNFTVPLTEPTVAGSMGVAVGAGVAATEGAGCSSSFLPHPAIKTRPGKTQIASHFLVFMMSPHLASNLKLAQIFTRGHVHQTGCHHSMRPHWRLAHVPSTRSLAAVLQPSTGRCSPPAASCDPYRNPGM